MIHNWESKPTKWNQLNNFYSITQYVIAKNAFKTFYTFNGGKITIVYLIGDFFPKDHHFHVYPSPDIGTLIIVFSMFHNLRQCLIKSNCYLFPRNCVTIATSARLQTFRSKEILLLFIFIPHLTFKMDDLSAITCSYTE